MRHVLSVPWSKYFLSIIKHLSDPTTLSIFSWEQGVEVLKDCDILVYGLHEIRH